MINLSLVILALVLALPPALQMFYGKPKLEIKFHRPYNEHRLDCLVHNLAIQNRALQWLRVTRFAADVFASFEVLDAGSPKVIHMAQPMIADESDRLARRQRLPGGGLEATITLISADANGQVWIHNGRSKIPLQPGLYDVKLTITASEKTVQRRRRFNVGKVPKTVCTVTRPPPRPVALMVLFVSLRICGVSGVGVEQSS